MNAASSLVHVAKGTIELIALRNSVNIICWCSPDPKIPPPQYWQDKEAAGRLSLTKVLRESGISD